MGNTSRYTKIKQLDDKGNYNVLEGDDLVIGNANTSTGYNFILESAVGLKSKVYTFKNISIFGLTITPDGSETIDDETSQSLVQHQTIEIISNGTNWLILATQGMATKDYSLAIAEGEVNGYYAVNKFGRTLNADLNIQTDVWDGANATDDIDVWVAPTTARIHDIVSTSASDTSAGAGAKTIEVYGLTGWGTAEVSETITMNGTTNVPTVNSYVIIHRMKVLTKGATDINVGQITATAQTDATVTAIILVGEGQTQMAIYGVPTTQTAYLTSWYASTNGSSQVDADVELLWNPTPSTELLNFQVKETQAVRGDGSNYIQRIYNPYSKFSGGGILKIQVTSDTNNADISAGFDLILVDN